jgi:hypothetical protein
MPGCNSALLIVSLLPYEPSLTRDQRTAWCRVGWSIAGFARRKHSSAVSALPVDERSRAKPFCLSLPVKSENARRARRRPRHFTWPASGFPCHPGKSLYGTTVPSSQ